MSSQQNIQNGQTITGKPMKGWVMATQNAFKNNEDLISWLKKAKNFVETLPPK